MRNPGKLTFTRITAAAALLLPLVLTNCAPQAAPAETAVTVMIVRHAEKAAEPADDPPLTEAGRQRAALLAHVASSSGISAAYATQYLRTQQTVEPLAAQLGLTVKQLDSGDTDGLVSQLLSENRGQTVVVAGHSNTVPVLVEKLTGKTVPPIDESEYDNLYVVTGWGLERGTVLRLRYGASAPAETTASP
jgi:broad specificity phosphatase PhoE